jgi:hypothetical protein
MSKLKISLPFLNLPDAALEASGQEHLPVADIGEDIVLFKDGGASLVLESTSLNFSLLSEKEQEAIIAAYSGLLNSLSFPIQVFVRTQKKDISTYLNYLAEAAKKITHPGLFRLMESYRRFILESIKKKNVLGKRFFIIIPFSPLELGVTKSALSLLKGKKALPFPKSYVIKRAKIALYPKRDHLMRQVTRFGVKLRQLNSLELTELFYNVYNPVPTEIKTKPI